MYYQVNQLLFSIGYFTFTFFVTSNLHFSGEHSHYLRLGERLLGKLSSGLYVLATAHLVLFQDYLSIVLCLVTGIVALLGSKFARQVTAFFSIMFSILAFDFTPIMLFLIVVTLAGIISKGYFFRSLLFQLRHLNVYR